MRVTCVIHDLSIKISTKVEALYIFLFVKVGFELDAILFLRLGNNRAVCCNKNPFCSKADFCSVNLTSVVIFLMRFWW